jgi:guanylate kinase
MVAAGDFLEYACVFDHHYGTARATLAAQLRAGTDVILEIDWQGARQVRELMAGCISIFILPPSYRILEERLRNRGDEEVAVVTRRMRDAVGEMSHYAEYDYVVINDDFERALDDLRAIVRAERLRTHRQTAMQAGLIDSLIA